MDKGFLLIDGNHVGHAVNSMRPMNVGEQPTQAIYGFVRSLRPSVSMYQSLMTPMVLWDGRSWRYDHFTPYKASRGKVAVTKSDLVAQKARDEYALQVAHIKEAIRLLGICQIQAANLEADDLAGLMVKRYQGQRRVLLVTGDKDWIQLVGPGVAWFDPIRDQKITNSNIEEKLGVKTGEAWLDVKCLMGDTSDEIPGVGGIGEKGAIELVNAFGSVSSFTNGVLMKIIDPNTLHKKFKDLALDEDKHIAFARNRVLMDLRGSIVPKPKDFVRTHQPIDKEGFRDFCKRFLFSSILKEFDSWIEVFERNSHA